MTVVEWVYVGVCACAMGKSFADEVGGSRRAMEDGVSVSLSSMSATGMDESSRTVNIGLIATVVDAPASSLTSVTATGE